MFERKKSIEKQIQKKLSNDLQKNALDFVAYMRANEMPPDAPSSNVFRYLGEAVCVLAIHPVDDVPGWNIYWGDYDSSIFSGKCDDVPVDEQLKNFFMEHIKICCNFTSNGKWCGCGSLPGKSMRIFGTDFDNLCTSLTWFGNPDTATLENIYKLADAWKLCVAEARNNR